MRYQNNDRCPHSTEIYCYDPKRCQKLNEEELNLKQAAYPCDVLLYDDFDYKITFHVKERQTEEWREMNEGTDLFLLHGDIVQHSDHRIGQIQGFPKENCGDICEVKMQLKPLKTAGDHKDHPRGQIFDKGQLFHDRIKPCKLDHDVNECLTSKHNETCRPQVDQSLFVWCGLISAGALILYTILY